MYNCIIQQSLIYGFIYPILFHSNEYAEKSIYEKIMFNGSNCDRKSQFSEILTGSLNPRDYSLSKCRELNAVLI